jgi:hypothetical protein
MPSFALVPKSGKSLKRIRNNGRQRLDFSHAQQKANRTAAQGRNGFLGRVARRGPLTVAASIAYAVPPWLRPPKTLRVPAYQRTPPLLGTDIHYGLR